MKAIRTSQPSVLDQLALIEEPDPGQPGPGEIRVRLQAASLNFHDLAVVTGRIPTRQPRIPLSDGAGLVEAVGAGVADFQAGDLVVSCFFPGWLDGAPAVSGFATTPGDGVDGYAREVVVCPASWFTAAPRDYSAVEAATLPTSGVTAWRALVVDGGLKAGDTVLVQGTGGVSIIALQLAKAMGATVIVTSSSDEKLQRAIALGADHGINYRTNANWAEEALALTKGRGVDHVIEVGGGKTLAQSIAACRIGGHIALIGGLSGFVAELPLGLMLGRQQRVQAVLVGSRRHQQDLVRALDVTQLPPVVDRVVPLARLSEGFKAMAAGAHLGKICIEI